MSCTCVPEIPPISIPMRPILVVCVISVSCSSSLVPHICLCVSRNARKRSDKQVTNNTNECARKKRNRGPVSNTLFCISLTLLYFLLRIASLITVLSWAISSIINMAQKKMRRGMLSLSRPESACCSPPCLRNSVVGCF